MCPHCRTVLWSDGKPLVKQFPRKALATELERVLAVKGLEDLCFNIPDRHAQHDWYDKQTGQSVLREQTQVEAWGSDNNVLRLNLSVDWLRPLVTQYHKNRTIGPISAVIANLPNALRSNLGLCLLLGITPGRQALNYRLISRMMPRKTEDYCYSLTGPHEPSAETLWKFYLPLIMELRAGFRLGIWLRSPRYPRGRLVKVEVAAVVADRPAAINLTGAPQQVRKDDLCSMCHASRDLLTEH